MKVKTFKEFLNEQSGSGLVKQIKTDLSTNKITDTAKEGGTTLTLSKHPDVRIWIDKGGDELIVYEKDKEVAVFDVSGIKNGRALDYLVKEYY